MDHCSERVVLETTRHTGVVTLGRDRRGSGVR
jgi:hypothetical protein